MHNPMKVTALCRQYALCEKIAWYIEDQTEGDFVEIMTTALATEKRFKPVEEILHTLHIMAHERGVSLVKGGFEYDDSSVL